MANKMFYRAGSMDNLFGFDVDYVIVDDSEKEKMLKDGWVDHPADTVKKNKKADKNDANKG